MKIQDLACTKGETRTLTPLRALEPESNAEFVSAEDSSVASENDRHKGAAKCAVGEDSGGTRQNSGSGATAPAISASAVASRTGWRNRGDMTGRQFGDLSVVRFAGNNKHRNRTWLCKCECGEESVVPTASLMNGNTRSCGCKANIGDRTRTHGAKGTPEYAAWASLKTRCLNPKSAVYRYYGARGVTIAPEWIDDFAAFLAHVGQRPTPGHSLDRWPNKTGGYEPGNVRWATQEEQQNNRRDSLRIRLGGTANLTIKQIATALGLSYHEVHRALAPLMSPTVTVDECGRQTTSTDSTKESA